MLSSTSEMARNRRPRRPQVHPKGPLETVDDDWKEELRAEMKHLGWDQKDLAGKIPASTGAISKMFRPGDQQTRLKARIEELVGWTTPAQLKKFLDRAAPKWSRLSVENTELVAKMINSLAAKPQSGSG